MLMIKGKKMWVDSAGGNGRAYLNYHELAEYDQFPEFKHNLVFMGSFVFPKGTDNLSIKNGAHGTDGWEYDGQLVAGLLGFSLHADRAEIGSEYWHNYQGPDKSFPYKGGNKLSADKQYRFFACYRTDRSKEAVNLQVWVDFGDRKWTQVINYTWTKDGWNATPPKDHKDYKGKVPDNVLKAKDWPDIQKGPSFPQMYHIWTRNNVKSGRTVLPLWDLHLGTIAFLA
jgi:hypothetical protein